MISKKGDYQFLTENALKNLVVNGSPLPVRAADEKRPMSGEDLAYLREMMLERWFYGSDENRNKGVDYRYSKGSWRLGVKRSDERIRLVSDTVDEEHGQVNRMLAGGSPFGLGYMYGFFSDRTKLDAIQETMSVESFGEAPEYEEAADLRENLRKAERDCKSAKSESRLKRTRGENAAETAYSDAVAEVEQEWKRQTRQNALKAERDEKISSAESKRDDELEEEDELNKDNLEGLYEQAFPERGDPAITENEYYEAVADENERHLFETAKIENEFVKEKEKAERECDKALVDLENEHDKTLRDLKKTRDDEVFRCEALYEKEVAEATETLAGVAGSVVVREKVSDVMPDVFEKGEFKAQVDRANAVGSSVIGRSFASVWYGTRFALYKRAYTPAIRTFADLERMDSLALGCGVKDDGSGGAVWDSVPFLFCGPQKWENEAGEVEYKDAKSHESFSTTQWAAIVESGWSVVTHGGFHFLFGARHEVDRIEKIVADVVQYRSELDNESVRKRKAALDKVENDAFAEMSSRTEFAGMWTPVYRANGELQGFVVNENASSLTEELYAELEGLCSTVSGKLEPGREDARKKNRIKQGCGYYVRRVTFTPDGQPAKAWTDRIDAVEDKLEDDEKGVWKDYQEACDVADEEYARKENAANARKKTAEEDADDDYEDDLRAAEKVYVDALYPKVCEVNTKLYAYTHTDEEHEAADKAAFFSALGVMHVAYMNATAAREIAYEAAKVKRDAAYEAAKTARKDELEKPEKDRKKAKEDAGKNRDADIKRLEDAAEESVRKICKEYTDGIDKVEAEYRDAVSKASRDAASLMANAEEGAVSILEAGGIVDGYKFVQTSAVGLGFAASRVEWSDGAGHTEEQERARSMANAHLSTMFNRAVAEYERAVSVAKATRWQAMKGIPTLGLFYRGKFRADIEPEGSKHFSGDVSESVHVVMAQNIVVYYSPRSSTGMDLSAYRAEQDEEDEDLAARKEAACEEEASEA